MKRTLTLFFFLLLSLVTGNRDLAQSCLWARNLGDTDNSGMLTSSVTDAAGNVYITGSFEGTALQIGTTLIFGGPTRSFFIAKYNSTGTVIWAKGAIGDIGKSNYITIDANGDLYVAGSFIGDTENFGWTTLRRTGTGPNMYLVKFRSTSGASVWAKGFAGNNEPTGVTVDTSGHIYTSGYFSSPTIDFGSTTLTNALTGNADAFLTKFDTGGNVLWAKGSATSTGEDRATTVATDITGNIYLAGYFASPTITFGTTLLNNYSVTGSLDMFLVKYDKNGTVLWAKSIGGDKDDKALGASCDVSGNVYLTGSFKSTTTAFGSATLTNAFAGTSDMFVAKYDPLGTCSWARSTGGIKDEEARAVAIDIYGNAYVAGTYLSPSITFGSTVLTNPGTPPYIFFTKYSGLGNVVWATSDTNGILADTVAASCLAADPSGDIYIGGYFDCRTIIFDTITLTKIPKFGRDIFLAKYKGGGIPTVTPALSSASETITVYPNPATKQITLAIPANTSVTSVNICDMQGEQVYHSDQPQQATDIHIRLPELPIGVYLLTATGSSGTQSLRLGVVR